MAKRIKQHTGSYLFEHGLLELLDFIADMEGQSRAVIVERMIRFYLLQHKQHKQRNNHYDQAQSSKCQWVQSGCVYQKAQKVFNHRKRLLRIDKASQTAQSQPKRAFKKRHSVWSRTILYKESFYKGAPQSRRSLFE